MKVIFLDHQGVMYLKRHPNPGSLDNFDKNTIQVLNSILQEDPEIEIVISSDWKYWVTLEEMTTFYRNQGLKQPIAYTPKTIQYTHPYEKCRAAEIKKWLESNSVTAWVAIDDLDMRPYLQNFVWTDPSQGLLQEGIKDKILTNLRI